MIPITRVDVREAEPLVLEVLRSGVLAQGPMVRRFEEEFAPVAGARHAVAVSNGTIALKLALQALDLEPGAEVVTAPFTFAATLNAILEAGATARFADIREDDFCVNPVAVDSAINDRTSVLMPVHLYGQTADMGALEPIARERSLHLVEDAAQAHGALFEGRPAGSFGFGCFSFYATKNLTSGEGGMITTSDDDYNDVLRVLRNQGMRARYHYELAGHNYRLTDLQAAVVIHQIAEVEQVVAARRKNAARLTSGLAGVQGLRTPAELPGRRHVWHQYTVLIDEESPVDRDTLVERLTHAGIGSGVYYPKLVYDYNCYRNHPRVVIEPTPVAESVARRCLSLPVHQHLADDEVDQVIDAVCTAMGA